jgi:hypothetical protein
MTTETQNAATKPRTPQALTLEQWIAKNCASQYEAALMLGVRQQNLSKIRRGEQEPGADIASRIVYITERLCADGKAVGYVPLWALASDFTRAELFGVKGRP